jgi:hypothetical protein
MSERGAAGLRLFIRMVRLLVQRSLHPLKIHRCLSQKIMVPHDQETILQT